jgi:mono/diheme cytochrome c family protein
VKRLRSIAIVVIAVTLAWDAIPVVTRADPPAQLYMLNCWGCHRPNGEGIPGTAPPLRGAVDFLRVPGGREYLISVPGVALSPLSNEQAAAVMNWILSSFSKDRLPADFKPYTAGEIAKARTTHLLDIRKARAELVTEMVAAKIRESEK